MSEPTRDEIAMALLRATDRFEAGQEDLPTNEYDMKMLLAGILADAVLALLASKRAAEPDVRTFGPIGPVERDAELEGVVEQAKRGITPNSPTPFWRVYPAPPVPIPQTAEPDAWMSATGTLATPTPDQPKEGDPNE